jgi:hypothetical protein
VVARSGAADALGVSAAQLVEIIIEAGASSRGSDA